MKTKKIVLFDGTPFFDGDLVMADLGRIYDVSDEYLFKTVVGKIYIDDDNVFKAYICQDELDGEVSPNKLGYKHSWSFKVDNKGVIITPDTKNIIKVLNKEQEPFDNDPMPDSWEIDEKIPENL